MPAPRPRLSLTEFVALMGLMFANVAFSIDAMLPAMGEIAAELSPQAPNRAQLIIAGFVLGMGFGTLFTGPLSDAFGRKTVIAGGIAVYIAGAVLSWAADSLDMLLAGRAIQGLGAAGPRIAALAIVRDLYSGREMARVTSLCMIVFTIVPAVAPLIGAGIIWLTGWRGIFVAFVLFSGTACTWLMLRQPETLTPDRRRPFRASTLADGIAEVLRIRQVLVTIAILSLVFAMLFTTLSVAQPVFDMAFGAAASFPYWFGAIALVSGGASLLNARIVIRIGMRRVIAGTLWSQFVLAGLMTLAIWIGALPVPVLFALYLGWLVTIFFVVGLTIGNLNALGMEPLGHLAGLGASILSSIATVGGVAIAVPITQAFDGTPLPHALGIFLATVAALAVLPLLGPGAEMSDP